MQLQMAVPTCLRRLTAVCARLAGRPRLTVLVVSVAIAAGCGPGNVGSGQRAAYETVQRVDGAKLTTDGDGNVVKVVARGTQMTDAQAAQLVAFSELGSLQIEGSAVTDVGLEAIGKLKQLQTFRAERTKISNAGMHHLAGLTNLRELFLASCSLSDDGLAPLGKLSKLTVLNLNDTSVTDAGLGNLAELINLESLFLRNTKVTGSGLRQLANLQKLKLLNLGGPNTTDEALQFVGHFVDLEMLYLDNSAISDAGVPALIDQLNSGTPQIKGLFLENTQLSDTAVESLLELAGLKNLAIVHLHGTRITPPAFMKLVRGIPEVSFVADYPAEQ